MGFRCWGLAERVGGARCVHLRSEGATGCSHAVKPALRRRNPWIGVQAGNRPGRGGGVSASFLTRGEIDEYLKGLLIAQHKFLAIPERRRQAGYRRHFGFNPAEKHFYNAVHPAKFLWQQAGLVRVDLRIAGEEQDFTDRSGQVPTREATAWVPLVATSAAGVIKLRLTTQHCRAIAKVALDDHTLGRGHAQGLVKLLGCNTLTPIDPGRAERPTVLECNYAVANTRYAEGTNERGLAIPNVVVKDRGVQERLIDHQRKRAHQQGLHDDSHNPFHDE